MAIPQALTDAMNLIDTETTALATVVDDLRTRVKTDMTPQEVDGVTQALGTVATRLKGIAADPNNPVPNSSQPNPAPAPATSGQQDNTPSGQTPQTP